MKNKPVIKKEITPPPEPAGDAFVAFLRGINVGGNRKISNVDLNKCFEDMGFKGIKIFLQSGNVVFHTKIEDQAKLKTLVESGLTKWFKYPAKVIITDIGSLKEIIKQCPFKSPNPEEHRYIVFLSEDVHTELMQTVLLNKNDEQIAKGNMVIYWRVKKGVTLDSSFQKTLSKARYKDINTVRNINTLEKIIR